MTTLYSGDFRKEVRKLAFKPMKRSVHYFRVRKDVEKAIAEKKIRPTDAYYVRQFLDRDSNMDEFHVVKALEALHEIGLFKHHYKYLKGHHRAVRHFAEKIQGKIDAKNETEEVTETPLDKIRERQREADAIDEAKHTGKYVPPPEIESGHKVSLTEKSKPSAAPPLRPTIFTAVPKLSPAMKIPTRTPSRIQGMPTRPGAVIMPHRTANMPPPRPVRTGDIKRILTLPKAPRKAA